MEKNTAIWEDFKVFDEEDPDGFFAHYDCVKEKNKNCPKCLGKKVGYMETINGNHCVTCGHRWPHTIASKSMVFLQNFLEQPKTKNLYTSAEVRDLIVRIRYGNYITLNSKSFKVSDLTLKDLEKLGYKKPLRKISIIDVFTTLIILFCVVSAVFFIILAITIMTNWVG